MDSQTSSTLVVREAEDPKGKKDDTAKVVGDSATANIDTESKKSSSRAVTQKKIKDKIAKAKTTKPKKPKKTVVLEVESSSDSDSDSDSSSSSDSSDDEAADTESSDTEAAKKKSKRSKKKREAAKAKKHVRNRKSKKPIKVQTDSDSDSDSGSGSDQDSVSSPSSSSSGGDSDSDSGSSTPDDARRNRRHPPLQGQLHHQLPPQQIFNPYQHYQPYGYYAPPVGIPMGNPVAFNAGVPALGGMPAYQPPPPAPPANTIGRHLPPGVRARPGRNRLGLPTGILDNNQLGDGHRRSKKSKRKSKSTNFKRVDQVWDNTIHNYKLQDTAEGSTDAEYEGYSFHVRRTFDWEGKYKQTLVDIKSKILRDALQEVMGDIKGVSLVEETPKLDPNLLFLYLEDMRKYLKHLKTAEPKGDKKTRKKEAKRNVKKREQLKVLVKYLDKDYEAVKNSLHPLLDNGLITFDLLWALWKPNTLAYTTTYGSHDQPRIFKADMAEKHFSLMKGDFYYIEGKYFEYDGKRFGYGSVADEIGEFRGARKITSLSLYPLKYHKNEEKLREELIDRGKKFVALSGVQYRSYDGMAYYKKKKSAVKVNITGRIMIDSSIHRRINPNYPISLVRPKDNDSQSDDEPSDNEWDAARPCEQSDSDSNAPSSRLITKKKVRRPKSSVRLVRDPAGRVHIVHQIMADDGSDQENNDLDQVPEKDTAKPNGTGEGDEGESDGDEDEDGTDEDKKTPEFSDEEYLIASPVVLGFAFAEKLWLEFTVSSVKEIQWNHNAYESLVLEPKTKDIVKALVESHKYHAAESIDDVIQGKGKGLVAVLHGPPGTGKTLTAEGISELLKCPLYMVSAGELGTDSRFLESELQKILDICHAWGAILLLDEADVFLEKRNMHDIHRNALVSIFLRQLEYFQGILFLTTNRVETFDDAFQSRIHIALRYDSLDNRAKKAIFKIFIERVRVLEKIDLMPFTEEDYTTLARHDLNGRQIKNTVRTAQALAVNKGEPLSMSHIKQVLDVQMSFDRDLKGGPGFQDAMRSYF
ncbi:aaa family atpase [Ophiostoma piceae UAMH 11346]|uniref:Aaa family atpase n=1 Tax=Ophiostoma piceae (strain UAMH 11346) TaxID=1262450 RepID=S3CDA3_OPHP1|nr:aaa family atpase [Ophiostoma piceae UAMH 11346]